MIASIKQRLWPFLKKYGLDCAVCIFGGVLSLVLDHIFSNSAMFVGIVATVFVEVSLLGIRQEVRKISKEYTETRIEQIAQNLQRLNIITEAVSFTKKIKNAQYEQAVETELSRILTAFSELERGKRRIYKKSNLYNEQKAVILSADSHLLTVHVVEKLEDLYRWDPDKMDRSSDFYGILYKTFDDCSRKPNMDRRRIVILPDKSLSEIIEFNKCLKDSRRKYILDPHSGKDTSAVSQRRLVLYYDSIERIVANQKELNFQVRFITSARAVATHRAIFDCIISDNTYVFEFSKADSLDVRAYVIEERNYIIEQRKTFEILWDEAEEWR